jgi:hypothetical protein
MITTEQLEKLKHKFSKIGLKDVDLSFLTQLGELSSGNMIQQIRMEIENAEDDFKAGKKIFWCEGKKMVVNEDDCAAPNNYQGCVNWDKAKKECKKKLNAKE